jgi:hypothetical protein
VSCQFNAKVSVASQVEIGMVSFCLREVGDFDNGFHHLREVLEAD